MKKIYRMTAVLILFLIPVFVFNSASAEVYDILNPSCDELTPAQRANSEICNESRNPVENPITGTEGVILRVANILAIIGGIIAVIIIIVAGITFMTSGGDSGKVQNSRNAIIYAVVGLVVIVLARSIVIFVINQTG